MQLSDSDDSTAIRLRPPREKKKRVEVIEEEFYDQEELPMKPEKVSCPKKNAAKAKSTTDAERAKRRLATRMAMSEIATKKKWLSRVIITIAIAVNIAILLYWLSRHGVDFEQVKHMLLKK